MPSLAEAARSLNRAARKGKGGPCLALLSDMPRLPDPGPLLDLLPAGAIVILRHPDRAERARLGAALRPLCRARRLLLLIADDFDLAVLLGAGLHLPERAAASATARIRLWHRRTGALLTVAAHSRPALLRAREIGADAALLSPVFATASHPGARALGIIRFRALARQAGIPVLALGGMTVRRALILRGSGAAGLATVGGLRRD